MSFSVWDLLPTDTTDIVFDLNLAIRSAFNFYLISNALAPTEAELIDLAGLRIFALLSPPLRFVLLGVSSFERLVLDCDALDCPPLLYPFILFLISFIHF